MNGHGNSDARERLFEMLALRATEGLSSDEARELDRRLSAAPDVDPDGFDLAAAATHLALLEAEEPMPGHLKRRIADAGIGQMMGPAAESPTAWVGNLGWWAAAAAVVVALASWWPRLQSAPRSEPTLADTAVPETPPIETDPDTLRLAWTATDDATAAGAGGEVVWNNERQTGFMRFAGLAANDPSEYQYQLWIFDRTRDERYPVDGGVFDVTEDGETVVPIEAKIRVNDPYLFAVTVEPPGGVVVSSRERIALLAQS